jgi:phosphatidylserine/phosphatidylglycerophosphate/cardiolipin synthase-like enzyme
MIRPVLNEEHLSTVLNDVIAGCRHRLFLATADLKDLHVPMGDRRARSLLVVLAELATSGVDVAVLHSGVPSGPMLQRLKKARPKGLTLRRCPRVHAKAVIADGRRMYLGSANFTGAGLGAKSKRRRNFEAGICTDELSLIDPVLDMLQSVFDGSRCDQCGRTEYCPEPLEEPRL